MEGQQPVSTTELVCRSARSQGSIGPNGPVGFLAERSRSKGSWVPSSRRSVNKASPAMAPRVVCPYFVTVVTTSMTAPASQAIPVARPNAMRSCWDMRDGRNHAGFRMKLTAVSLRAIPDVAP